MSKFEVGKTYRTRDGREAKVYATDGAGSYPIHGSVGGIVYAWMADGRGGGNDDLMPPRPEPLRRKMWGNFYGDGTGHFYDSRERADQTAGPAVRRTAVPVMVTEIEGDDQ